MAATLIHAEFGDDCNLYAVMGIPRSSTDKEITRAYHKLALKYHPDKQRGDEASCTKATAKFQAISAIHSILSSKEARAVYDDSGTILSDDYDEKSPSFQMWTQYFARIFPKVTTEDITRFEQQYRYSDEEKRDVLSAYVKHKGEMGKILDTIMLSTDEDEERFAEMIQNAITEKELKTFPLWRSYVNKQSKKKNTNKTPTEQKRKEAKRKKEALEAEELFNKIRGKQQKREEELDSTALGVKRKCEFDSLLESLEAKFTDKRKKSKRKGDPGEISNDEFIAAQKRLKRNRKQ